MGPNINPGIMGGIKKNPICIVGCKKIPTKTIAETAPEAPKLW